MVDSGGGLSKLLVCFEDITGRELWPPIQEAEHHLFCGCFRQRRPFLGTRGATPSYRCQLREQI